MILSLCVGCQTDTDAECDPGFHPCPGNPAECCLDTTSHYVEWMIDTLGVQGGDNWLMDAAIIDENNIWVVGELHTDSLGYSAVSYIGICIFLCKAGEKERVGNRCGTCKPGVPCS